MNLVNMIGHLKSDQLEGYSVSLIMDTALGQVSEHYKRRGNTGQVTPSLTPVIT